MSRKASTAYVWFDTEFTSLELDEAQLLQVAVMLTDKNLKRITPPEEDLCFYIRLSDTVPLSPWVEKNLPELVKKCRSHAAVPVEEVDEKLTAFVDRWCGTPNKTVQKRPLMAGNVSSLCSPEAVLETPSASGEGQLAGSVAISHCRP